MADPTSAGDAIAASPAPDACARLVDRDHVATFMERYAERLVAGPAVREFAAPINRNRHDPQVAAEIRIAIRSLAQAVRTGVDTAEADWPMAEVAA